VRAYEVLANPSVFSKYTVEFVKHFSEHWEVPNNDEEFQELFREDPRSAPARSDSTAT
jgi:hypothetical protein